GVSVDEAGQQTGVAQLDGLHLGAGLQGGGRTHALDPAVLDEDARRREDVAGARIEKPRGLQQRYRTCPQFPRTQDDQRRDRPRFAHPVAPSGLWNRRSRRAFRAALPGPPRYGCTSVESPVRWSWIWNGTR